MSASPCEHMRLGEQLPQVVYNQLLQERWEGETGSVGAAPCKASGHLIEETNVGWTSTTRWFAWGGTNVASYLHTQKKYQLFHGDSLSWLLCNVCVKNQDKKCLITGIMSVCLIVLCMNKGFLFIRCWIEIIQSTTFKIKYHFRWSIFTVSEARTFHVFFPESGIERRGSAVAEFLPLQGNPKARGLAVVKLFFMSKQWDMSKLSLSLYWLSCCNENDEIIRVHCDSSRKSLCVYVFWYLFQKSLWVSCDEYLMCWVWGVFCWFLCWFCWFLRQDCSCTKVG